MYSGLKRLGNRKREHSSNTVVGERLPGISLHQAAIIRLDRSTTYADAAYRY